MPSDIRSFFGGKAPDPVPKAGKGLSDDAKSSTANKRRSKSRMVIEDDSDEDGPEVVKTSSKKTVAKNALNESLNGKETSTADYFASTKSKKDIPKSRPMKTEDYTETKSPAESKKTSGIPSRTSPTKRTATGIDGAATGRSSSRKRPKVSSYLEGKDNDTDEETTTPARKSTVDRRNGRNNGDHADDRNKAPLVKKTAPPVNLKSNSVKATDRAGTKDKYLPPDEDENDEHQNELNHATSSRRKRKSVEVSDDDSDDFELAKTTPKKQAKQPQSKKPRASTKKDATPESADIQAIFDSIPTVRAPTPPPKDDGAKTNWRQAGAGNSGLPPASGAKERPVGAENCLVGLTFVFTGLLDTISREEGQELVKRYGGKVTTAPSSKTSYVVLGNDAGPVKLEKIRKMDIKTINEDGLFALIQRLPENGGSGKAAEKNLEKKRADADKVRREAVEMEQEEKKQLAEAKKAAERAAAVRGLPVVNVEAKSNPKAQLWTTKYAPTKANQICGNKGQVEKIQTWLVNWPRNHKFKFKLPGKDGSGTHRAIIIHGPPGIGKTTAAHLAAQLEGYDVIESNASDTRSKKLVESGLGEILDNSSLLGYFAGDGKEVAEQKKKIVLIMDEVDGMSAGDRGGVGALAKVCKKTDVPIILICNDRKLPKMKPFDHVAYDVPFRRPTVEQVRSRVATICAREGLSLPVPVMDALIEGSNKDIRQIINMLSTIKLDQTFMDFNKGKSMTKAWEKHIVLKPWDICQKMLGSGMFAPSSTATLNDKIELYFNDHEFSYLMIQENYLSTKPILANGAHYTAREHTLKSLELADKAAESISDGDLVDRMIHGSQQQWSLMPTHAVFSSVRPASFVSGSMTSQAAFTKWLGNNSKYGKLTRFVKEIQSHMRLRSSGDRHEIRQQYLPVLWTQLINRLQTDGKDAVDEVIDLMDSYFLTRDDFDYIMELGLGAQDQERVNLTTATKSAFTRIYNQRTHPLPFMKAGAITAPSKAAKVIPDLEEAIEDDDAEDIVESKEDPEGANDQIEEDLTKDKYIKKPKAKKESTSKKAGPKKSKNAKSADIYDDEDDQEDSDEDGKPTKAQTGKAKPARKGKSKA